MSLIAEIIRRKFEIQGATMNSPTKVYLGSDEYGRLLKEATDCGIDTKPTTEVTVHGMRVYLVSEISHFNVC